jgi:hypothetical protein
MEDEECVAWLREQTREEAVRLERTGARVRALDVVRSEEVWIEGDWGGAGGSAGSAGGRTEEERGRVVGDGTARAGERRGDGGGDLLRCVNRVQLRGDDDLRDTQYLLVSETRACSLASREGWRFVFVVLVGKGARLALFTHLFRPASSSATETENGRTRRAPNALEMWEVRNDRGEAVRLPAAAIADIRSIPASVEARAHAAVRH